MKIVSALKGRKDFRKGDWQYVFIYGNASVSLFFHYKLDIK